MNQYKYIYVLGIGGSGMSSISKYLSQKGLEVKGYDQRRSFITNQLEQDGIKVEFNIENIEYLQVTKLFTNVQISKIHFLELINYIS